MKLLGEGVGVRIKWREVFFIYFDLSNIKSLLKLHMYTAKKQ